MLETDLHITSPSLYLDSYLGVRPSTEPYAEEMRAQEVLQKAAAVQKDVAIAHYQEALSAKISGSKPLPGGALDGLRVDGRTLQLIAAGPLPPGVWHLRVNGEILRALSIPEHTAVLTIAWESDQSWLHPDNVSSIILIQSATNTVLAVSMLPARRM